MMTDLKDLERLLPIAWTRMDPHRVPSCFTSCASGLRQRQDDRAFHPSPNTRTFAELLIDLEENHARWCRAGRAPGARAFAIVSGARDAG